MGLFLVKLNSMRHRLRFLTGPIMLWAIGIAHADDAGGSPGSFIPVPLIDVDPNSGVTLGLLPTWLKTDSDGQITRIIAPDLNFNPEFGFGGHARLIAYPSSDTQWSIVAGGQERVERVLDYEFQTGRERSSRWGFDAGIVVDRDGSPRFYGIGNRTPLSDKTNYTAQQKYARATLSLNLSHAWQVAYTFRARKFDVLPGTLDGIPSIENRFPGVPGLGGQRDILNRVQVSYDTRDDLTVPRHGNALTVYGGAATRYRAVGYDLRQFWSPTGSSVTLVTHIAARYMPGSKDVPFWALSNIGGDQSVFGESLPLRAYGSGRFYDRNAFTANFEYRWQVLALDAFSTHIELELTPFVDVGDVFADSRSAPLHHAHRGAGLGFRGIARPFVVGYLDIGYGSEGAAAFTGINYPF